MNLRDWDERYRTGVHAGDQSTEATLLVKEAVAGVDPGTALDLACGTGRNATYLASLGWRVTAVDGAPSALRVLESRDASVRTIAADLEQQEFPIQPDSWDLILTCYYLQRDLFPAIKDGLRPQGIAIAVVHTPDPGEGPNYKRANPGELRTYFEDFEILHYYEGASRDPSHKRAVAEIVARKPAH